MASAAEWKRSRGEVDIKSLLDKYLTGSTKDYDIFVSQLTNPSIQGSEFILYLKGLRDCVSLLDKEFEVLVGVLLKIDWVKHDVAVINEYQGLLLNLISAHTFYLRAVLRMIVQELLVKKSALPGSDGKVDEETRKSCRQSFAYVHRLLKAVILMVPMTPQLLLPLLSDCYPYIGKPLFLHECYVQNLLLITEYLPTKRREILELVIDKVTRLDVTVHRDELVNDADSGPDSDDEMFDMTDSGIASQEEMMHEDANKEDHLMELLFQYTRNVCYQDGKLDWEATKKYYRDLLGTFDRVILPTHGTSHIQFLWFYTVSFHESLCEGFLDYLWKKFQNPNCQAVYRQAAIQYFASLLARASFIHIQTVRSCLDLMSEWIKRYISNVTVTAADIKHHGPFYSACQALFYVFVFRHTSILSTAEGVKYAQKLNLQNIVTCRLNPLRICLPTIAHTFASVTRQHQLAFCDTVIERNKRCLIPIAGAGAPTELSVQNPLDSFFPFDPYLLKRSSKYVEHLQNQYEGIAVAEVEEVIEDSEEWEYMDADTDDIGTLKFGSFGKAHGPSTPSTPVDLLMYSTSPGFKF